MPSVKVVIEFTAEEMQARCRGSSAKTRTICLDPEDAVVHIHQQPLDMDVTQPIPQNANPYEISLTGTMLSSCEEYHHA